LHFANSEFNEVILHVCDVDLEVGHWNGMCYGYVTSAYSG